MLLPIGDDNTQRVSFPVVTTFIIALNVFVFILELTYGNDFVVKYSLIPAEFFAGRQSILNVFTSMFLHGGIAHIFGNMLYLYVFGDNVEDNLGKFKFVIFYFGCGVAAMLAQAYASPDSTVPSLGASGAIAGVLAAYLILFPTNRVRVLIFFPFVVTVGAWFILGLWIFTQLISGWTSHYQDAATAQGGIAYMAHIGGFFTGVALTFLFRRREAKHGTMKRLGVKRLP
ncbi:MAG TPA: rhomboid family intramembrane serine protease [Candidatus Kapabacteria bacterium]|nr:rhomboid family intramembrane serine protease [Candidatus Kapabacteria bacterium]